MEKEGGMEKGGEMDEGGIEKEVEWRRGNREGWNGGGRFENKEEWRREVGWRRSGNG